MANPSIRVLLVDDHFLMRQELRELLKSYADITVVAEAGNGLEAVDSVQVWEPDIVVIDVNMPIMDGLEATSIIKRQYPATIIIGLSLEVCPEMQTAMMKAGAFNLLSKESACRELYAEIMKAML